MVGRLLCALRGHRPGAWVVTGSPGLATYTRSCRCGKVLELEHRWLQFPVQR